MYPQETKGLHSEMEALKQSNNLTYWAGVVRRLIAETENVLSFDACKHLASVLTEIERRKRGLL